MGVKPGEAPKLTYESSHTVSSSNESQWKCTLKVNRSCGALLWGDENAERRFVGEICRNKRLAEDSAAEKFWLDPDVRKKAKTLPPSNRQKERVRSHKILENKRKAAEEKRRKARVAKQKARKARQKQAKKARQMM